MKIENYRDISNVMTRTVHAFILCFDKVEFESAGFEYYNGIYQLKLHFYYDIDLLDLAIESQSSSSNPQAAVKKFYNNLISDIENCKKKLEKADIKERNAWQKSKVHDCKKRILTTITAMDMLKDIIASFDVK